ncbi:MAG: T9SS type A sorting domain-containing protein [Bacteroidia bacterium]|nr:T9SS type A sorting domain-containing protein [Bacteroidia bacterium]
MFQFSAAGQTILPLGKGLPGNVVSISNREGALAAVFLKEKNIKIKTYQVGVWDGAVWNYYPEFSCDTLSFITGIKSYLNVFYISGSIKKLNGNTGTIGLIKFNDTKKTWEHAGIELGDNSELISSIEIFKGLLIAGGKFKKIVSSDTMHNISAFNGITWGKIIKMSNSYGTNGIVTDLAVNKDTLAICGLFSKINGVSTSNLAQLHDTVVESYSNTFNSIKKIAFSKNNLFCYVTDATTKNLIYIKTNKIFEKSSNGLTNIISLGNFTEFQNEVWACGSFDMSGDFYSVIRYDGSNWKHAFETNLAGVNKLFSFRDNLFLGGSFNFYKKYSFNHIARYSQVFVKVSGRIYYDKINNCNYDSTELLLPDRIVEINPGKIILKTDNDGQFFAILPQNIYTITVINRKYWTNCGSGTAVVNYSINKDTVLYFGILPVNLSITDVKVNVIGNSGWKARKDYAETYTITYENTGTKDIPLGNLSLEFNKTLKFIKGSESPNSVTGSRLSWLYTDLKAGEKRSIDVDFKIPISTNSDSIYFAAGAFSSASDNYYDDNYDTLSQTLSQTSINGNTKLVFPEPLLNDSVSFIQPNLKDVNYLIKFENTGSDTVKTIYVIDTIDLNLDIQFIEETGASHSYTTQVINCDPSLGKGVLIWTFKNIKLPPNPSGSNDFTNNRGHIGFKIAFNSIMPEGYNFKNKAQIIFDYQPAIKTNYTYCVVKTQNVSIDVADEQRKLTIYPIPATIAINIKTESIILKVVLNDLSGKAIITSDDSGQTCEKLNVSELDRGIYFLNISTANGNRIEKIILQ